MLPKIPTHLIQIVYNNLKYNHNIKITFQEFYFINWKYGINCVIPDDKQLSDKQLSDKQLSDKQPNYKEIQKNISIKPYQPFTSIKPASQHSLIENITNDKNKDR